MGLKDFRNKIRRNLVPEMKEQAPQYWEEDSYMIVVPMSEETNLMGQVRDRIAAVRGIDIIDFREPSGESPAMMKIRYNGETYPVAYVEEPFTLENLAVMKKQPLSQAEETAAQSAGKALKLMMNFHGDPQQCYHLHIKLCAAAVAEAAIVMDESAEKILSGRWVKMTAASEVEPSADSLFTVQGVSDGNEVWLHTHGLIRFGLRELEVLCSDNENAEHHFEIINALAKRMISGDEGDIAEGVYYLGLIGDEIPVVVTAVPWTEGLQEYSHGCMGGASDRENGHNSKTSLVFAYKGPQDQEKHILSKVTIYDEVWEDHAMFFISTRETQRMSRLARERFDYVRPFVGKPDCQVVLKLALKALNEEEGDMQVEHIWFELVGFEGNGFRARLTQNPYYIDYMHAGDEAVYTVEDITDWVIQTPESQYVPDNVYLLHK